MHIACLLQAMVCRPRWMLYHGRPSRLEPGVKRRFFCLLVQLCIWYSWCPPQCPSCPSVRPSVFVCFLCLIRRLKRPLQSESECLASETCLLRSAGLQECPVPRSGTIGHDTPYGSLSINSAAERSPPTLSRFGGHVGRDFPPEQASRQANTTLIRDFTPDYRVKPQRL